MWVFYNPHKHITMETMVEVKQGGWIQSWVNNELHQMLSRRISLVNSQDQIVQ